MPRALAGTVVLCTLVAAAHAQPEEPAPSVTAPPDLQQQIDVLRAEQARLQARLALLDGRASIVASASPHADPLPPPHKVTFTAAPGAGLTLGVGDWFSLSLRARAVVRETITIAPDAPKGEGVQSELSLRTVRLFLQGFAFSRDLRYFIQLGFGASDASSDAGKEAPSPIYDAYVDYLRLRDLHVRVGQFFVPVDRARTTYEWGMQLPERAQVVNELGLDRDVGIALSSSDLFGSHGRVGYVVAVQSGEGKNRVGATGIGFLYTARLIITPFGPFDDYLEGDPQRVRRPRLAIGLGGAYNQNAHRTMSTHGPMLTLGTFDYGHASADVVFKLAGFSLMAEVVYRQSRQGSLTGPVTAMVNGMDLREWSRSAIGYLVQVGVMVHSKVELAARYDDLRPIGQTDPALVALAATSGRELNGGLNVYLHSYAFKIQSGYQYLFGDRFTGGRHAVQLQLDASF